MGKTWVLDTDTKGTGAQVVPLEKVLEQQEEKAVIEPRKRAAAPRPNAPQPRKRSGPVEKSSGPLGPGQVRKKATGEIGRVKSVDAKAGTATVHWLRQGRTSTVPLTAISRR